MLVSNVSIITFNKLLNMLRLEMLRLETRDNALRQDNTMGDEDMTYSVRLMLDSKAAAFKEPGSSLCNREEFRAG